MGAKHAHPVLFTSMDFVSGRVHGHFRIEHACADAFMCG